MWPGGLPACSPHMQRTVCRPHAWHRAAGWQDLSQASVQQTRSPPTATAPQTQEGSFVRGGDRFPGLHTVGSLLSNHPQLLDCLAFKTRRRHGICTLLSPPAVSKHMQVHLTNSSQHPSQTSLPHLHDFDDARVACTGGSRPQTSLQAASSATATMPAVMPQALCTTVVFSSAPHACTHARTHACMHVRGAGRLAPLSWPRHVHEGTRCLHSRECRPHGVGGGGGGPPILWRATMESPREHSFCALACSTEDCARGPTSASEANPSSPACHAQGGTQGAVDRLMQACPAPPGRRAAWTICMPRCIATAERVRYPGL